MAKKKKSSKSKAKAPAQRSPFWAYAGAVVLILSALFVLLGGLHSGGTLPLTLYQMAEGILGMAAYVLPVYLGYWGIAKFLSQDHRAPTKRLTSLFVGILLLSALFAI